MFNVAKSRYWAVRQLEWKTKTIEKESTNKRPTTVGDLGKVGQRDHANGGQN
jgi:hypothetical protein